MLSSQNVDRFSGEWSLLLPFGIFDDFTRTEISTEHGNVHCIVEIHQDIQGSGFQIWHNIERHERDFRFAECDSKDKMLESVAEFVYECVSYHWGSGKEEDWKDRFLALLRTKGVFGS